MSLSKELQERGFIHQFSAETLEEILDGPKRTVYHGIDPTADSAHAGNFVNWVLLRHLVDNGHKVLFLVGGGTGMIGDPKPDAERELVSPEELQARVAKLKAQAEHLMGSGDITFVNNHDWLSQVNLIDFLRDIGKHFTINELVKKDAIATRLSSETGLSYTEFAYPLLQAYDYLQLHKQYNCDLQIGGSDQWGNIISGVDLIRRVQKVSVHALTQPLVIDKATGKKFGKSEGNAVWLDPEKTSPYTFYQFWLNTSDESVIDHLKRFTLIALEEIAEIEKEFMADPGSRSAQKRLADEVTTFVHSAEVMGSVKKVSEMLFGGGDMSTLSDAEKEILQDNAPVYQLQQPANIVDVLVAAELASSKREARTFIESGAVTFLEQKIESVDYQIEVASGDFATLKRGKKQYVLVKGV